MRTTTVQQYLLNCFLLVIPALALNLAWTGRLPRMWQSASFWKDIPPAIAYGENISRFFVVALPALMPLRIITKSQRTGLAIYVAGILIYFLAWFLLVRFPSSRWSTSLVGATAAAWASLPWLVGIGLIGDSLFIPIPYRSWVYIALSAIFTAFHTFHAVIVYMRIPQSVGRGGGWPV